MADIRIIEAIQESIQTGRSVQLSQFVRRRRPILVQEIKKAPIREPKLIRAKEPSGRAA